MLYEGGEALEEKVAAVWVRAGGVFHRAHCSPTHDYALADSAELLFSFPCELCTCVVAGEPVWRLKPREW